MIDKIMNYNKQFVEEEKYKSFITSKYPDKKIAVLSCLDTRLTELLPAAWDFSGIHRYDALLWCGFRKLAQRF